jgi:hypothetical protein
MPVRELIEVGRFVWLHWAVLACAIATGLLGYVIGLANPLYCARCRKILTTEEIFVRRFHHGK